MWPGTEYRVLRTLEVAMCFSTGTQIWPNLPSVLAIHDSGPGIAVQPRLCSQKQTPSKFEPGKQPCYFPLYRLFNKDPYNGLLFSPSNCAVQSPIDPKQPGPLFSLLIWTILSYPTEETKEGTSHSSRKFQTHGKNWIKW